MSAAVVAFGAASALGVGRVAFDVGEVGAEARRAWSTRARGKPFGRVTACDAPRPTRPRALLELGLTQVIRGLDGALPDWRSRRVGLALGTSSGGFAAFERNAWEHSAYFAPLLGVEALLGFRPARLLGIYGACASSALALGLGLRWLELGELDCVIAGGYDAESDWVCAGFDALKATSAGEPRSYRAERDGMALGEGVALLALAPGTRGFGYVRGFGASTDAVHITAPDRSGSGLARAALSALRDAGIEAADIELVSGHGTGTSYNDAAELAALTTVLAGKGRPVLHAAKPSFGHTLGAAAALESLVALSAIERGILPASAGEGAPMAELPAELASHNRAFAVRHCLKLSTAFGGANAALVLSSEPSSQTPVAARPVQGVRVGGVCRGLELDRVRSVLTGSVERLPRSDALSELCVAAAAEVLREQSLDPLRTGVVVGSVGACLEADAAFGARIGERGPEHAEPRRFPATSPNACAGHVAIAFGLGGPSHAVGSGPGAWLEALEAARVWISAGDADAMLVIAAEAVGPSSHRALQEVGVTQLEQGAVAVLLAASSEGPAVEQVIRSQGPGLAASAGNEGFAGLLAFARAAHLPGPEAFGSVRPPE
jgi:3-oxoacyl-[acyl-carrier-protein] synthase II